MVLYAAPTLDLLQDDVHAASKKYHPHASPVACAYVAGMLAENTRIEKFSPEDSSSPKKGYSSFVERRQWCTEHPEGFKDLGDYCLIWFGLFYPRAERRGFAEYTSSVGAASYQQYGSLFRFGGSSESLFDELAADFNQWGTVLNALAARQFTDDQLIEIMQRHSQNPREPYAVILKERGLPNPISGTYSFS